MCVYVCVCVCVRVYVYVCVYVELRIPIVPYGTVRCLTRGSSLTFVPYGTVHNRAVPYIYR